ncbi:MAG: RNA methyltransferase [Candidatus Berkelbacteria bacterium]
MRKKTTNELVGEKNIFQIKNGLRNQVYLILDNIRSMYNVGAIFRTADAALVEKLYLCGITATPPRKEIEKTALKTVDFVPWEKRDNTIELIKELKKQGIQVIALEQTNDSINYKNFDFQKPVAIIVGHEVDGVSDDLLQLCDGIVDIPMYGIANSLNVSTAAGIILYHLCG